MIGLLLALAGLGLGIAVLAVVWVVVHRDFGAHRLMVDDLDIYRSANELIKQHGDEALVYAAMRADELAAGFQPDTSPVAPLTMSKSFRSRPNNRPEKRRISRGRYHGPRAGPGLRSPRTFRHAPVSTMCLTPT